MDTKRLCIRESDGLAPSLALSLRAILQCAGRDLDVHSIGALLGLCLRFAAPRDQQPLFLWPSFGQHAFLDETAALLRIRLRELHPPESSIGLADAKEYAVHFRDSYRPLIVRALEHGQPTLAWGGWPGEAGHSWGLITETDTSSFGLRGAFPNPQGELASLASPPVLVYIVEEVDPVRPPREAVMADLIAHVLSASRNRIPDHCGILTGPAAYAQWLDRLRGVQHGAAQPAEALRGHSALARSLVAARESAQRVLELPSPGPADRTQTMLDSLLDSLRGSSLDAVRALCAAFRAAMPVSLDPHAAEKLAEQAEGRKTLYYEVAAAAEFDISISVIIESLHLRTSDS